MCLCNPKQYVTCTSVYETTPDGLSDESTAAVTNFSLFDVPAPDRTFILCGEMVAPDQSLPTISIEVPVDNYSICKHKYIRRNAFELTTSTRLCNWPQRPKQRPVASGV